MTAREAPTSIRLSTETIDRADALVRSASRLPEFALAKPSRGAVLRLAVLRGLDALEAELAAPKRKR